MSLVGLVSDGQRDRAVLLCVYSEKGGKSMIDFENADFLKLRAVDNSAYEERPTPTLAPGEEILASFKTVRDGVVLTTLRVPASEVRGLAGAKPG